MEIENSVVRDSPCKRILEILVLLGWKDGGSKEDSREQTINGVVKTTHRRIRDDNREHKPVWETFLYDHS